MEKPEQVLPSGKSAADLAVWKSMANHYHRSRSQRVVLTDITEAERLEIEEAWDILMEGRQGELNFVPLIDAADAVLGKDEYRHQELRKAMERIDLDGNGCIDYFEFKAYMVATASASRDATAVLASSYNEIESEDIGEDMIMIGSMRLSDLIRAYRRRVVMERLMKGQRLPEVNKASREKAFNELATNSGGGGSGGSFTSKTGPALAEPLTPSPDVAAVLQRSKSSRSRTQPSPWLEKQQEKQGRFAGIVRRLMQTSSFSEESQEDDAAAELSSPTAAEPTGPDWAGKTRGRQGVKAPDDELCPAPRGCSSPDLRLTIPGVGSLSPGGSPKYGSGGSSGGASPLGSAVFGGGGSGKPSPLSGGSSRASPFAMASLDSGVSNGIILTRGRRKGLLGAPRASEGAALLPAAQPLTTRRSLSMRASEGYTLTKPGPGPGQGPGPCQLNQPVFRASYDFTGAGSPAAALGGMALAKRSESSGLLAYSPSEVAAAAAAGGGAVHLSSSSSIGTLGGVDAAPVARRRASHFQSDATTGAEPTASRFSGCSFRDVSFSPMLCEDESPGSWPMNQPSYKPAPPAAGAGGRPASWLLAGQGVPDSVDKLQASFRARRVSLVPGQTSEPAQGPLGACGSGGGGSGGGGGQASGTGSYGGSDASMKVLMNARRPSMMQSLARQSTGSNRL